MLSSLKAALFKAKAVNNVQASHGRVQPVDGDPPRSPQKMETPRLNRQLTRKHTQRVDAAMRSTQTIYGGYSDSRAEREAMRRAKEETVSGLITGMRSNMAAMKQRLADVEGIGITLKESQEELVRAMGTSQDSASNLAVFNEEMEGDFKLMEKKALWMAASDAFLMAALGKDKDVPAATPALAKFLCECLQLADPDATPLSAAVVGWHPASNEMLKVFYATDAFELKAGANLRNKTQSALGQRIWDVMRTGEPDLLNPHGLERTSKANASVMPLKTTDGKIFAVLCSGPPCVPDELIETLCRLAGPLLERIWKREKALEAIANVQSFIKSATLDNQQLVYIMFHPEKTSEIKDNTELDRIWHWQPLMHRPNSAKVFELELKWSLGEPIGVLEVSCGTFTEMNEQLIVLLHTTADVLQSAIDCIEGLVPGDTPPLNKASAVLTEFEAQQESVPTLLQAEIRQQLQIFDATKIFSELRSFDPKAVDKEQFKTIQGCLCLIGYSKKSVPDWKHCQNLFRNPRKLHEQMLELDLVDVSPKGRKSQDESNVATKGLDFDFISARSPAPVQIMIRWLQAVRMTHHVSLAIMETSKPPPADPIGDRIFGTIDKNSNGVIDQKELISYLLNEFPSKVAHTMLRVLDSDNDREISLDEWRKGWHDGLLTNILVNEKKKKDESTNKPSGGDGEEEIPDGARMGRRRTGQVMELSVAAAAKNFNAEALLGEATGDKKKGKSKAAFGSKVKK